MFRTTQLIGTAVLAVGLASSAFGAGFTQGNLVVSRIGAVGSPTALGSSTAAVFLDEFTTVGSSVQAVAIPSSAHVKGFGMTLSGTSTAQGHLELSEDGRYLTMFGYDAPVGTTGPSTNAAFRGRTVTRISARGDAGILSNTRFEQSGATPRAAVTVDGSFFYTAADGGSGPSGGLRYVTAGSLVNGAILNATTTNIRTVNIYNGQLYIGASTGVGGEFRGVSSVGTGLPTGASNFTLLNGMGGNNVGNTDGTYDFFFASPTTLYLADDDFAAPSSGGLQKWTFNGTVWAKQWTALPGTNVGVRSLTGATDPSGAVILYAITSETSANRLVTLTDAGGSTAPAFATLATATTNTIFRGVEFAPVPEPTTLAAFGALAAMVLRRK
jgi:hypothetical protein